MSELNEEELRWFYLVQPPDSWCKPEMWERLIAAARQGIALHREVSTLRNFLGGIKNNVDLALGDYGQPGSPSAPAGDGRIAFER